MNYVIYCLQLECLSYKLFLLISKSSRPDQKSHTCQNAQNAAN